MKKIIVVTGASSGMGEEFVHQIIKKEKVDEIWVIARRKERLDKLKQQYGSLIRPLVLDLTKISDLQYYNSLLVKETPVISILANCAGFGKLNHFENIDLDTHLQMIDLNIKAVISMISYSLPFMFFESKIMNLDSCSAFFPIPYINVYSASKAFILNYSRALNQELKYRRIHVLAVCPYWVETEFFNRAVDKDKKPVVIHYGKIYQAKDVINQAIIDLYSNKDVSIYGFINKLQVYSIKVVPNKIAMKIWMKYQRLNGNKTIRNK